jgi:hypothetical protein
MLLPKLQKYVICKLMNTGDKYKNIWQMYGQVDFVKSLAEFSCSLAGELL